MTIVIAVSAIIVFAVILALLTAYICFRRIFYIPDKYKKSTEEFPTPHGEIYEPYRESMVEWLKEIRAKNPSEHYCTAFDGLKLFGRFYQYSDDAPIELLMHGYRGEGERDMSGGVIRCAKLGHSAFVIDQRGCGNSDGNITTFGVKEYRDCLSWVDYIIKNINKDAKIIICGVSMGASTVMIASSAKLPENVVGVLADCGYSSAEKIIKKVMRDMKLPAELLFPFAKLGAKLFGHFDIDEASCVNALKNSTVPVLIFHGDTDDFLPYEMGVENHSACSARKLLVKIEGAGHGLCYPVDKEKYLNTMKEFFGI